jgi:hypothetical protein
MGDMSWSDERTGEEPMGRDRVRWGPILAGVLAALTTMFLLGLAGIAAGLTAVDPNAAGNDPNLRSDAARNALLWSALTAVVSFFVGGYVASKTADVRDGRWGALQGALVFLAALPIMLWLASQGAGAAFGAVGDLAGRANANTSGTDVDAAQAADALRKAATGGLVGTILGLIAASAGGTFGARDDVLAKHDEQDDRDANEKERGRDRQSRSQRGRSARQW